MPGHVAPGPPPRRGALARVRSYPQRMILDAFMALAAIVLERRIRKALRSGAGVSRR